MLKLLSSKRYSELICFSRSSLQVNTKQYKYVGCWCWPLLTNASLLFDIHVCIYHQIIFNFYLARLQLSLIFNIRTKKLQIEGGQEGKAGWENGRAGWALPTLKGLIISPDIFISFLTFKIILAYGNQVYNISFP